MMNLAKVTLMDKSGQKCPKMSHFTDMVMGEQGTALTPQEGNVMWVYSKSKSGVLWVSTIGASYNHQ